MIINMKLYEQLELNDPKRFYPEWVPIIPYEPLKTFFQILESPEEIRKGVVSLVSFKEDDLIAQCTGASLNFQTLHSLQHAEKVFFHDPFFSGYLLHSCEPNCRLDMSDFSLHAIQEIKPFSLLTIDYEETEEELYQQFECKCGSSNCRGWIKGKKFKEN
jgi:hypothetical protein